MRNAGHQKEDIAERAHDHTCERAATGKTGTPPIFHLGYRRWLDGLRGLAILAVLACHLNLLQGGFLGVDLFFVLSGFLITTLLIGEWQRNSSISLKGFYIRRALRLFPALLALLLVSGLATFLVQSAEEAAARRQEIVIAACYLSNWPSIHGIDLPTLGHTWSLSVEEQFYVIWPLLLGCMLWLRLRRAWIIGLVCAGTFASAGLRAYLWDLHADHHGKWATNIWRLYMGLDTRADALLIGCLVGLLAAWDLFPKSRSVLLGIRLAAPVCFAALAYLVVCMVHHHHYLYYGLLTAVALLVAVILVRLLSAPSRLGTLVLESSPLVGLGRISYALYLFHLPIIHWLRPIELGWRAPANVLLVTGLSLTAAVLSYFCIERPCLRLKQRWQARVSGTPQANRASTPGRDGASASFVRPAA